VVTTLPPNTSADLHDDEGRMGAVEVVAEGVVGVPPLKASLVDGLGQLRQQACHKIAK